MARKPASPDVDTLSDIRDGAFRLFGRHGYDGVSIDQIAKAAGLSKGALYWHFKGKEDLFLDCLKRLHGLFDEHIFAQMVNEPDAVARLMGMFRGVAGLIEDKRLSDGVAGYWLVGGSHIDAIRKAQENFEQRNAESVRETLQLGIDQGKMDLDGDLDDMSRAVIAVLEAIILPLRSQSAEEIHRLIGVLARTMMRAYTKDQQLVELFRQV